MLQCLAQAFSLLPKTSAEQGICKKAHPLRWHRQVVVWLVALCQSIQRELAHLRHQHACRLSSITVIVPAGANTSWCR